MTIEIDNIVSKLDEGSLSSKEVVTLFNLVGYNCIGFTQHGEFYCLHRDIGRLLPLFQHIKNSDTLEKANEVQHMIVFKPYGITLVDVERVWKAFHNK